MKYVTTIILILISFSVFAQGKRLIKFKTDCERCLNASGVPIENCFITSNSDGKFVKRTLAEVLDLIMIESEGSVDSIWVDGDSLRIVFFDSPPIAYYAPGLNGIYSAGNNNKQALVNQIFYPTTGSGMITWQTPTTGLARIQMNASSNTPFQLTAQASEGRIILGLPSTNDQCFMSMLADGETWKMGNNNGAFNLTPRQFMSFPVFQIDEPTSITSNPISQLRLHPDTIGTISMSGYTPSRPFNTSPLNFAGWDATGKLQKYEIPQYSESEQEYPLKTWLNGETIYWRTWFLDTGENDYETLTGLTVGDVQIIDVNAFGTNTPSDMWSEYTIELDATQTDYRFFTASNQRDIYITVFYILVE